MRKVFKIGIALCLVFCFSFCFVGCSSDYLLNKHSKNLNTYNIDLTFDVNTMTASAHQTLEYKNRDERIVDYFVFHLYPTAFSEDAIIRPYTALNEAKCFPNGVSYGDIVVKNVYIDNNENTFDIVGEDNDKLKIDIKKPLDIGDSVIIGIDYELKLPNCTHRFGYYQNNINLANFYPILAVFEDGQYDKTPYYATGDPFYSNCANYNVKIEINKDFLVFSSGNQTSSIEKVETKIIKFEAKAVRDFALVMGNNFQVESTYVNDIKVNYVGYSGDDDLKKLTDLSATAVSWCSDNFIDYPYKELNIVKTPFVHGGMEYPGVVMISDTIDDEEQLKKVIVHEIAHEWWYGIVGVNETINAWIDEGLAEYTTALFFDKNPQFNITYDSIIKDCISSFA